jgi:hypothetical protein
MVCENIVNAIGLLSFDGRHKRTVLKCFHPKKKSERTSIILLLARVFEVIKLAFTEKHVAVKLVLIRK